MLGRLKDLTINRDESQNITITVQADCREMFDDLKDADIDIEIKKHYKPRSLDANAKAWVLIDALANKLQLSKTEVYRRAIKEISGVSDIVCVKQIAADTLCSKWRKKGTGWMAEQEPSKLPGCVNVTLWYGSSTYDTRQMGELIDFLIVLCNEQGIPTMSPKEKERLMQTWTEKKEKEKDE